MHGQSDAALRLRLTDASPALMLPLRVDAPPLAGDEQSVQLLARADIQGCVENTFRMLVEAAHERKSSSPLACSHRNILLVSRLSRTHPVRLGQYSMRSAYLAVVFFCSC